jgi:hypothetical protein
VLVMGVVQSFATTIATTMGTMTKAGRKTKALSFDSMLSWVVQSLGLTACTLMAMLQL